MDTFHLGSLIGSLSALLIYHVYTYGSVFCFSAWQIQLSKEISNALVWMAKHQEVADAPTVTLAIQTLRNTILVAIFVGGASFQYGFTYLNNYYMEESMQVKIRSLILATLLMISFLCWATVIRCASHLGYFVGALKFREKEPHITAQSPAIIRQPSMLDITSVEDGSEVEQARNIAGRMEETAGINNSTGTAAVRLKESTSSISDKELPDTLIECRALIKLVLWSFSLGFRFMFVSIPFAFYAAGPEALLISTGLILLFLYQVDHVVLK